MKISPTKEAPPSEEAISAGQQEGEGPVPEVNGHTEEVEEKETVKSEQVKETEAESHSNASADTEVLPSDSINMSIQPHPTYFQVTTLIPPKKRKHPCKHKESMKMPCLKTGDLTSKYLL